MKRRVRPLCALAAIALAATGAAALAVALPPLAVSAVAWWCAERVAARREEARR